MEYGSLPYGISYPLTDVFASTLVPAIPGSLRGRAPQRGSRGLAPWPQRSAPPALARKDGERFGERHETKIHTEEVETYKRQGGYTLLAESVVVDPDHSEQLNTLLTHLTDYWCEQYPDRYITKIYAQAESKRGDILIQKLFFAPREDLAPDAYMLNLARPGASRFVRRFQECMETKRKALEAAQKR